MPFGLLSISISFATIPVVQNLFQMALVYSFAAAVYQAVCLVVHPTTHLRTPLTLRAGQHSRPHAHCAAARRTRWASPERHQCSLWRRLPSCACCAPHAVAFAGKVEPAGIILGHQLRCAACNRHAWAPSAVGQTTETVLPPQCRFWPEFAASAHLVVTMRMMCPSLMAPRKVSIARLVLHNWNGAHYPPLLPHSGAANMVEVPVGARRSRHGARRLQRRGAQACLQRPQLPSTRTPCPYRRRTASAPGCIHTPCRFPGLAQQPRPMPCHCSGVPSL